MGCLRPSDETHWHLKGHAPLTLVVTFLCLQTMPHPSHRLLAVPGKSRKAFTAAKRKKRNSYNPQDSFHGGGGGGGGGEGGAGPGSLRLLGLTSSRMNIPTTISIKSSMIFRLVVRL